MDDETDAGVARFDFSTTDPAEAEAFFCTTYGEQRLTLSGRREDFVVTHSAVATLDLAVCHLRTGLGLTHAVDGMLDDVLAITTPLVGHMAYLGSDYQDVQVGPGDVVLGPPTGPVRVTADRFDVVVVALDRARVTDYAATMTGVDAGELRFDSITPVDSRSARQWTETVAHVRDNVFGNPSMTRHPVVLDQAFRSLAAAALSTFPNTALARATGQDAAPVRGDISESRLRTVLDYLTAHADRPIDPVALADVAGAPMTEIVDKLRRRGDRHPAELLRRARLSGARRELLHGGTVTVPELAARWGFTSADRFRDAYRREFGESPDQTRPHR